MAVLKTQCPECDAKIRLNVDGTGAQKTECPACGHTFTAKPDPKATAADTTATRVSAGGSARKTAVGVKETTKSSGITKKPKATRHDDDDDDDDAPKKKKKKKGAQDEGKKKLLVIGSIAGVLILCGVVAVVYAISSGDKKPKESETANNTTTPPATMPLPGVGTPGRPPTPPTGTGALVTPDGKPPAGTPGGGPAVGPGGSSSPPGGTNTFIVGPGGTLVPVLDPDKMTDEERLKLIPPPPKVTIAGSLVPESPVKITKPTIPPLSEDEDPFVRARNFKPDGRLPDLPALPDRSQRPTLALDSGGHTALINKVFFTPDGKRLITIGEDKAVRIWDPTTNETIKTLRFPAGPGNQGSLLAAAMSRSGKRLAVAGVPVKDAKGEAPKGKVPIFVVSPETGAFLMPPIALGSDTINCMHFSNDGERLAVGCDNGVVQVFDMKTGRVLGSITNLGPAPTMEIKFNPIPKTNYIASLGADRYVLLLNLANANQRLEFPIRDAVPITLAWSNEGKHLAVGCTNGTIKLFGLDGRPFRNLPPIVVERDAIDKDGNKVKVKVPVAINQLQFLPGDNQIAVVGSRQFAGVVDSDTGKVRVAFNHHTNTVFAVDVAPDGQRIVTCGGNNHDTLVWDADNGKLLQRMVGNGTAIWALGWAKDGKSIAWGTTNKPEDSTDTELPLEHVFRLDEFGLGGKPDPSKYTQVVESDEGVNLVVGRRQFLVKTPGRNPTVIDLEGEPIYSATLLPKANAVVVGGAANIHLVNPVTGRKSGNPFIGHTSHVLCVTASPDGRYFATGSIDQTIRIWHKNQEEPVLSIFVAGREWVAWTPQGYYACSPHGERLMAWQVNTGTGTGAAAKTPQVHPAERFRASLYQPALLKYIVPAGNMQLALAMAKKYDKALDETRSVADVLPPEVTIDGFAEAEVKVEQDTLSVKATAKSAKHPITAMRLLVNGRPHEGSAGIRKFDKPETEATATWEVKLVPGTYALAVIADTGVSRGMSKVGIAVKPGTPPKPNLYVLAMGVSKYPKGVNPLNYCASDARLLAKAFQEKSKDVFAKIEVKIVTDADCTKQGMLDGLAWLKSKMTPQDVGIVSFSGHGTRDLAGRFYLVPVDIDPKDSERTCFPGDVFKDKLDAMPGRLVAILDACHSGTVGNDGKPPKADTLVRDLTAEDSGVIVMCASLGSEYAIESKICRAGFYSMAIDEGLSGYGDVDGDGIVYLHELDLYATTRVRQLSSGEQNPTFSRPASVRPFPIAKAKRPD